MRLNGNAIKTLGLLVLVLAMVSTAQAQAFRTVMSDSFDGSSLDPAWIVKSDWNGQRPHYNLYAPQTYMDGWPTGWWSSNPDSWTQTVAGGKLTVEDLVLTPAAPTAAQAAALPSPQVSDLGSFYPDEYMFTDNHNLTFRRHLGENITGEFEAKVQFSWDQKGAGLAAMQGLHFQLGSWTDGGYWEGQARTKFYDGWNAENKYQVYTMMNTATNEHVPVGDHDTGSLEVKFTRDASNNWKLYLNGVEQVWTNPSGANTGAYFNEVQLWFEGMDYSSTSLGATPFGGISVDLVEVKVPLPWMPGDADMDNDVDATDLAALRNSFGTGTTWAEGDFDGDGDVDATDLAALRNNFGMTYGASAGGLQAVPEPASLGLLALGGLALLARRRRA